MTRRCSSTSYVNRSPAQWPNGRCSWARGDGGLEQLLEMLCAHVLHHRDEVPERQDLERVELGDHSRRESATRSGSRRRSAARSAVHRRRTRPADCCACHSWESATRLPRFVSCCADVRDACPSRGTSETARTFAAKPATNALIGVHDLCLDRRVRIDDVVGGSGVAVVVADDPDRTAAPLVDVEHLTRLVEGHDEATRRTCTGPRS